MFKTRDTVTVPDGRQGILYQTVGPSRVVVQFGAGGPFEYHDLESLRFSSSSDLQASSEKDFLKGDTT